MKDPALDRLFRAAAAAQQDHPNEMPFGFDTRVLARARTRERGDLVALGRFLRRVVLISLGVIACASAGAYQELRQNEDLSDSLTDEYVIADNSIGGAFEP
jgi:hypothetical protein